MRCGAVVSNTAAAAILYPVAYETALVMDVNPLTFCIGLLISVSLCFASPIGSPTHMLVYGPGGYRFSDFMRIGIFMNIIMLIATLVFTPLVFPFYSVRESSACAFLFYYAQGLDGGWEADVGQALDDGGGQGFGRVAGGDVAVIVGVELALGFQGGQDAVAEQFAGP